MSWSLLCFLCIYKRTELEIEWLNCSKQKRKTQVCCLVGPLPAKHVATWGQVFHAVVTSVACFGVAHGGFARHGSKISLLVTTPRQKILHQKNQTVKLWLGFRQVFDKGVHSPKEGNSLPKIQTLGWIDSNTRLRINFVLWRDEGLWDAPLFCSAAPYADNSLIVLFIYKHRLSQRVPADVRKYVFSTFVSAFAFSTFVSAFAILDQQQSKLTSQMLRVTNTIAPLLHFIAFKLNIICSNFSNVKKHMCFHFFQQEFIVLVHICVFHFHHKDWSSVTPTKQQRGMKFTVLAIHMNWSSHAETKPTQKKSSKQNKTTCANKLNGCRLPRNDLLQMWPHDYYSVAIRKPLVTKYTQILESLKLRCMYP